MDEQNTIPTVTLWKSWDGYALKFEAGDTYIYAGHTATSLKAALKRAADILQDHQEVL